MFTSREIYRNLSDFHKAWVYTKMSEVPDIEQARNTLSFHPTEEVGQRILADFSVSFESGAESMKGYINSILFNHQEDPLPEEFPPAPTWISDETLRKVVMAFQTELGEICRKVIEKEASGEQHSPKRRKISFPPCESNPRDLSKPLALEEISTALYLIPRLAAFGCATSHYMHGILLLKSGDSEGVSILEPFAKEGNIRALHELIRFYRKYNDLAQIAAYAKMGADHQIPEMQHYLAELYEKGSGVDLNPALALDLYRKAARQGWDPSQKYLSLALKERDPEEADYWRKKLLPKPGFVPKAPLQKRDINSPERDPG